MQAFSLNSHGPIAPVHDSNSSHLLRFAEIAQSTPLFGCLSSSSTCNRQLSTFNLGPLTKPFTLAPSDLY
jgi:hypothetical protein